MKKPEPKDLEADMKFLQEKFEEYFSEAVIKPIDNNVLSAFPDIKTKILSDAKEIANPAFWAGVIAAMQLMTEHNRASNEDTVH